MKYVMVLVCFVKILEATKYSNTFIKCKRAGPDTDECLRNAIDNAFQRICTEGIPELGISNFNPHSIASFTLDTNGDALNLVQKYFNPKIYGFCDDGRITKAHFNNDENTLSFTGFFPKLDYIGKYNYGGRVMMLQIKAEGNCNLTQINSTMENRIHFEEKTIGDEKYFSITSYDVNVKFAKGYIQVDHIFDNKLLSDSVLAVFNENLDSLWEPTKGPLERVHSEVLTKIVNLFFSTVPISQIFLD